MGMQSDRSNNVLNYICIYLFTVAIYNLLGIVPPRCCDWLYLRNTSVLCARIGVLTSVGEWMGS